MLSMKTLRVAIVTMGSALLLGPGMAAAQTVLNLDGSAATMNAPVLIRKLAAESISTAEAQPDDVGRQRRMMLTTSTAATWICRSPQGRRCLTTTFIPRRS